VRQGVAIKAESYGWRQLAGATALAGIGFTMSLYIAAKAFPVPEDFAAAKLAVFIASASAGAIGTAWLAACAAPAQRQLAGATALAGIGFTMSLYGGEGLPVPEDFAAAKLAVFIASASAGAIGTPWLAACARRLNEEAGSTA
jgi:Na+/H+ antiporter NhaA